MTLTDPPGEDEVEVSLLGPGIGESVVIHVGAGEWIVVDSCRGRGSTNAAPLEYLRSIDVDVGNQVRRVVATHAHNDHIQGIAQLFEACRAAEFVYPEASGNADFYTLLELDDMSDTAPQSYSEYRRVLETVRSRQSIERRAPMFGVKDGSVVYRRAASGSVPDVEALALAPSDEAVRQALQVFREASDVVGLTPYRIATDDPNTFCAVIWIAVGDIHLLLGSDLLVGPGEDCGWKGVLLSPNRPSARASCFKLPHHGAPNAHHPPVWSELLEEDPLVVVTPYWSGQTPRPSPEDSDRICSLTSRAFVTCKPGFPTQPDIVRSHAARLRSVATNVKLDRGFIGHVRARRSFSGKDDWRIELVPPARPLCA